MFYYCFATNTKTRRSLPFAPDLGGGGLFAPFSGGQTKYIPIIMRLSTKFTHDYENCQSSQNGVIFLFRYDRLNELVKETGVKKSHICRLLGKSPYYLRDAEKIRTNITGEALKIIADAVGTTPEYLAGMSDEKYSAREKDGVINHISDIYDDLSPENRQRLEEFAEFLHTRQQKQDPSEKESKAGQ